MHKGVIPRDNAKPFKAARIGRQPLAGIGNTAPLVQQPRWSQGRNHTSRQGGCAVSDDAAQYRTLSIENKDIQGTGALSHCNAVNAGEGGHTVAGYMVTGANTPVVDKNNNGVVCAAVHSPFSQCVETHRGPVKTAGVKRQRAREGSVAGADGVENDNAPVSKRLTGQLVEPPVRKYNRLSLKSRVRRDGSTYGANASRRAPLETPGDVSTGAGEAISKPLMQTPANTDGAARDANTPAAPTPEPRSPFQPNYVYEDISDADEGALEIPRSAQHAHTKQNADFFDPLNNALNALATVSDDAGDDSLTPEQIRAEFQHLVRITCNPPSSADDASALSALTLAAEELMLDISTQSTYSAAHELVQVCNTDIEQCVNKDAETDNPMYGSCTADEGLCEDAQGTSTQDLIRDTIHWQTPTNAPANTHPVSTPQPLNTNQTAIIVIDSDDESEGSGRPSVIKLNTRRLALPRDKNSYKADDENSPLKTRSPLDAVPPHPAKCVLTQPKKHKNKSSGTGGDTPTGYTPSPRSGTAAPGYTTAASVPPARVSAKRKSTSGGNSTPAVKYRRMMVACKRVLRRCSALAKTSENAGVFEHYETCFDRALDEEGAFIKARATGRDQPWRPVPQGLQWYQTPLNPSISGGLTHFVQIGGPSGRMVRVVEDGERPSTSAGAGVSDTGPAEHRSAQHHA